MRQLILAPAIAITLTALAGCERTEYQWVEAPTKPGNYVRVFESAGKQWLEIIEVDDKGEAQRAAGVVSELIDLSKPLPRINVSFQHCGLGAFVQPQVSLGKVAFLGFSGGQDGCEIQNPPTEYVRLDTKAH